MTEATIKQDNQWHDVLFLATIWEGEEKPSVEFYLPEDEQEFIDNGWPFRKCKYNWNRGQILLEFEDGTRRVLLETKIEGIE